MHFTLPLSMKIIIIKYHCLHLIHLGELELLCQARHPGAEGRGHAEGQPLHLLRGHCTAQPPHLVLDGSCGGDEASHLGAARPGSHQPLQTACTVGVSEPEIIVINPNKTFQVSKTT